MNLPDRILLSRTDRLGDVLLCFPLAAFLKQVRPDIFIGFLGTSYTRALIEHCPHIDRYEDRETFLASAAIPDYGAILHLYPDLEVARKAAQLRIPVRVGIRNKIRMWPKLTHSILLSRSRSDLHEAELNLQLLRVFDTGKLPGLEEIRAMELLRLPLPPHAPEKRRVILHPFSAGSAREWPLHRYTELVQLLQQRGFEVWISGSAEEKERISNWLSNSRSQVRILSGSQSLTEFMNEIQQADALVACSTGPLHIAAALGKVAVGIYSPLRPIFARRWGPLGPFATALSVAEPCRWCRKRPDRCTCMESIEAQTVVTGIEKLLAEKYEKESDAAGER
ncbi:MAG: glycosyltransferase family 9 protein [Bacteroidia bacterium]|nr:glycosyltransferase family 9 protein [Bacteroidia bacterium]